MVAAIIFGSGVFAQEDDYDDYDEVKQPKFLFGCNLAFDFQESKINDSHKPINKIDFHFKPYFGYSISNKLTIGAKLGLNYYENAFADLPPISDIYDVGNNEIGITDGNSFDISPFLRFQDTLAGKFRYYIDFCLGAEFSGDMKAVRCTGYSYYTCDYKLNYYYASIDIGILFLLSQNTGIEFKLAGIELGNKYEKLDEDIKIESINFDFFSDFLQPNLGIVVNF